MQCTLNGNSAPLGGGIGGSTWEVRLDNTIITFSSQGDAVACSGTYTRLTCCDLYGNAGGDWTENIAGQYGMHGNIREDPLFCDPENGDFALDCNSPCAADNNPECGQIGAWPVGCGPTPVMETTWGAIKSLFRDASK